jgi:hypothetical protein
MNERAHLEAKRRELTAALRDEAATLTDILMIDRHVPEAMRERVREVCLADVYAFIDRRCVALH